MKLFHLSDLHIGKRVNEFSMIEDQKYILERILDLAEKEKPDGVILAGDIYDKQIPSAEAVQVFDEFITRLAERKLEGSDSYTICGSGSDSHAEVHIKGDR